MSSQQSSNGFEGKSTKWLMGVASAVLVLLLTAGGNHVKSELEATRKLAQANEVQVKTLNYFLEESLRPDVQAILVELKEIRKALREMPSTK